MSVVNRRTVIIHRLRHLMNLALITVNMTTTPSERAFTKFLQRIESDPVLEVGIIDSLKVDLAENSAGLTAFRKVLQKESGNAPVED